MATYSEVLIQIQRLTPDEQLRLLEYLAALIRQQIGLERQAFSVGDAAGFPPGDATRTQAVENSSLNADLRRKKIVEILEKIAASNVFANVSDPVEWQRDLRQDRPLPRRNE